MSTATQTRSAATNNGRPNGETAPPQDPQQVSESSRSSRFLVMVEQQFSAASGSEVRYTDQEKALALNLFAKIDLSLKKLEADRLSKNSQATPITWANINMDSLAMQAYALVKRKVDALQKNYVHVVPRWITSLQKYEVELQLGFMGRLFVCQKYSTHPIDSITILPIHEGQRLRPLFKSQSNPIEGYDIVTPEDFDYLNPGRIAGGIGYISYNEPTRNRLVLITMRDLERSRKASPSKGAMWGGLLEDGQVAQNESYDKMAYKTFVHRTCDAIVLDPSVVADLGQMIGTDDVEDVIEDVQASASAEANARTMSIPAVAESVVTMPSVPAEPEKAPVASGQPSLTTDEDPGY